MISALRQGLVVGLLAMGVGTAAAQEADPQRPLWLRAPAISPDGRQLAFGYGGQIWLVPSDGGEAVPLTGAPFYSAHPVWSPDGERIAFAANRHGNADVFIMPVAGGPITRLTYHSQDDTPTAFSPDGAQVYFNSARLGDPQADAVDVQKAIPAPILPQLYSVPAEGGRSRLVLASVALDLVPSRDGRRMLYTDNPSRVENPWRKHQVSDAARDIWLYTPETGEHRVLTEWRGEDREALFSPGGDEMIWLSEREGSANVWRRGLEGGEPEQVTFHERWPVRFLSAADDGTLAYAWNGELWRLAPEADAPERIAVRIRRGNLVDGMATVPVNDQVTELAVSPGGAELALVARGEVFVVSVASGATRRITTTPAMERFVTFSPDGRRLAYASLRNGDWDLVEARLTREEDAGFAGATPFEELALIDSDSDVYQPRYSPDGGRLAYVEDRSALRVLDLASGESVEVLPAEDAYSYQDGDMTFDWGPEGRWLVARTGYGPSAEIELLDARGEAPPRNLSRNGYTDHSPQVSADGSLVLWRSDRQGLRAANAGGVQEDVFAAFLSREAFDAFRATPEERARRQAAERARLATASDADEPDDSDAGAGKEGAGEPASGERTTDAELPDLDGLAFRTLGLTPFSSVMAYYRLSPDNQTLLVVALQQERALAGFAIDLSTGAARQLFTLPPLPDTLFAADASLSTLYVMGGGRLSRYDLASGTPTPVPFAAEVVRDVREEVAAIFAQNWRTTRETFYRPDMQGADWEAIGEHYRRFLPHIFHWEDLAVLLSEMAGELNASHQGSHYVPNDASGDRTAALGLYYDQAHRGEGMRITAVIPGGPADRPNSDLVPGAVILAVDGRPIAPEGDIHRLLNRRAGQSVRLAVRPAAGGEPVEEVVRPISLLEEHEFAYRRWVAKRREIVEELSGGRLGYIHVRGMTLEPYQAAYSELFGRYRDAEAVIVDIRANGGGNLHDQLVAMLTGRHDSSLVSRNGVEVVRNPVGRFTRPSALLVSASSYSDASVFPTLYQQKGIGAVIGERVPGTGTAVVNVPQIEARLSYRVPELGFRLTDGRWFENMEVVPDILVDNDPESVAAGRDRQLERAVEHLLETLAAP